MSPSSERRFELKKISLEGQLKVLDSYPLSKYIQISEKLLCKFDAAVHFRRLNEAYIFGLRFANVAISSLPEHPEWKSSTNAKGKKRLMSQVKRVLEMMEIIKKRMDAEELIKIKSRLEAQKKEEDQKREEEDRAKQKKDRDRRREEEILHILEAERELFFAQQRKNRMKKIGEKKVRASALSQKKIEESAMAKLSALKKKNRNLKH